MGYISVSKSPAPQDYFNSEESYKCLHRGPSINGNSNRCYCLARTRTSLISAEFLTFNFNMQTKGLSKYYALKHWALFQLCGTLVFTLYCILFEDAGTRIFGDMIMFLFLSLLFSFPSFLLYLLLVWLLSKSNWPVSELKLICSLFIIGMMILTLSLLEFKLAVIVPIYSVAIVASGFALK